MRVSPIVEVESDGLIAAATACWRLQGNTRATVVVKAEFSFVDGVLVQVQAEPVRPDTESAFLLNHAEVLFAGLRCAPGAAGRIALWRGAEALLGVDVDPTDISPGGRIPPFAPERVACLQGLSPADLQQAFVDLPDGFDSTFFQCAPPSQRLASLAGGDTVVLDNLVPGHRQLTLRVPTVEVAASGRMGERVAPVRLRFDTVFVDAETRKCTMLWRGRIAATSVESLERASAIVEHRVADPGQVRGDIPAPWPPAALGMQPAAAASPFEGTVALTASAILDATANEPIPFARSTAADHPSEPKPAIPGAPWANATNEAPPVVSPVGITETLGVGHLEDHGTSPPPPAVQPPEMVVANHSVEPQPPSARLESVPPTSDDAERDAAERSAAEAAEEKRRQAEQTRALAEAEERRRVEAERFAAEQRAAEQAAADRDAEEAAALKASRKKIKTGMYGSWKFKKK